MNNELFSKPSRPKKNNMNKSGLPVHYQIHKLYTFVEIAFKGCDISDNSFAYQSTNAFCLI